MDIYKDYEKKILDWKKGRENVCLNPGRSMCKHNQIYRVISLVYCKNIVDVTIKHEQ